MLFSIVLKISHLNSSVLWLRNDVWTVQVIIGLYTNKFYPDFRVFLSSFINPKSTFRKSFDEENQNYQEKIPLVS